MKYKIKMSIVMLLVICFSHNTSYSADKWKIGFNEPFIVSYLKHKGFCPTYPNGNLCDPGGGNAEAKSWHEIANLIGRLAGEHVGVYREIIAADYIKPYGFTDYRNTENFQYIMDIVHIYYLKSSSDYFFRKTLA